MINDIIFALKITSAGGDLRPYTISELGLFYLVQTVKLRMSLFRISQLLHIEQHHITWMDNVVLMKTYILEPVILNTVVSL